MDGTAKLITEYVHGRAGSGLRAVVTIRNENHEIHYLSDGLKRDYSKETYAEVVDAFRLEEPFHSPGLTGKPIGERRALIDYHENACVIQLPYSGSKTILISVSREAARDLIEFIEACRNIVRDQS